MTDYTTGDLRIDRAIHLYDELAETLPYPQVLAAMGKRGIPPQDLWAARQRALDLLAREYGLGLLARQYRLGRLPQEQHGMRLRVATLGLLAIQMEHPAWTARQASVQLPMLDRMLLEPLLVAMEGTDS